MLHEELKRDTSESHRALEKKLVELIRGIRTTDDYVRFLKLMYGYYAAIEEKAGHWLPGKQTGERRTARRLLSDIAQYEVIPEVSLCNDLPEIDSFTSALGAMYVVEGSALGGPHIARMISAQLGSACNVSLTFFNGHPEEIAQNWSDFRSNFGRPFNEEEKHSVIHTANTTFLTFSTWIEQHAFV